MDYVGKSAHTDHGLGTITQVETQRGSKSFRVAGRGFDVWVPETKLHLANHEAGLETTIEQGDTHDYPVTYPYDPSPQYPVDLFRKEQTILPGDYEIDPEDRLHPSDEDGKRVSPNRPYPGPNPDLFAKSAAYNGWDDPTRPSDVHPDMFHPAPGHPAPEHEGWDDPTRPADVHPAQFHHGEFEDGGDNFKEWGADEWHKDLPDGPERTFGKDAAAPIGRWDEAQGRHVHTPGQSYEGPLGETMFDGEDHTNYAKGVEHDLRHVSSYRPAGLDARYAHIPDDVDLRNPIVAFHQDPLGYMERHAYAMTAGEEDRLFHKFADEDNLLSTDKQLRTAAWTDVRQKAQRLRHEGRVHVNHVTPQHIYATVDGDNGTYDTMIVKGASGAFTGGQSIANWYCDCDWGKWAFQRKYAHVGRLCSHAYAAYLDMQSHTHKDNGGKFKAASIVDDFKSWAKENNDGHLDEGSMSDFINTCEERVSKEQAAELYDHLLKNVQAAPERDYDIPYTLDNEKAYKTADVDALRQRPLSLTPDLRVVPQSEGNEWTDVTKDDRETTGPEQIVHFGAIASMLHTADGDDDGGLWSPKTWFGDVGAGLGNALLHPESIPGYGAGSNFIDQHNVQKHPELLSGGGQPPQPGGVPAGAVNPAPGGPPAANQPPAPGGPSSYKQQYPRAEYGQQPPAGGAPPPAGAAPGSPVLQGPHVPGQAVAPTPKGVQPDGSWQHSLDTTGIGGGSSYTVKPGDTLADIAQRSGLGGNYQDLAKSNNIADPNKIDVGQEIKIPGQSGGGTNPAPSSIPEGDPKDGEAPAPGYVPPGGAKGIPGVNGGNFVGQSPTAPANVSQVPGVGGAGVTQAKPPATPQLPTPPAVPGLPGQKKTQSRQNFAALLHHAENDDDDQRPDTGDAAAKLDRLRELCDGDQSDHYQNMDSYNDEIRELVEDLNEAGVDAMPFVASRLGTPQGQRKDNDPSDGDANFAGQSNPNWADEAFNGSGPDPKLWSSDSASYIDEHERPDFQDLTEEPQGDIIKFNDSRSKPEQGPRHGSRTAEIGMGNTIGDLSEMSGLDPSSSMDPLASGGQMAGEGTVAARHYADDQGGYFNPNNPTDEDWEQGSGRPFANEVGHQLDQANPLHGGGGEEGGEEGGAEGLAEEAPELLAMASRQSPGGGFSLEAFDRGEFSLDDVGGGELRRANRIGGGPRSQVRVDHGARGWKKEAEHYQPPEGFGNDGDPDPAAYADPGADSGYGGADILAGFQRSAGALEMMHGHGGTAPRQGSLDDFSSSPMVQSMLRTAGRVFTPSEEAELEGEEHHLGARNLPTESDLAGTHYLLGM